MTLIQLEYIVALDTYRSFLAAAEKCFVTQPTLSMQVQKLEDELEVKLFDRGTLPIEPTEIGAEIIKQARLLLKESARIREIIDSHKHEVKGTIRVGIIPTLAPYLLPPLIARFPEKYPAVKLEIWEYNTEEISRRLKREQLDCGILSTPLNEEALEEYPLFYERFVVYAAPSHPLYRKKVLSPEELILDDIWLLNEGHCMRNQMLNICRESRNAAHQRLLEYNTGSVETLKKMVEQNKGWTILPELSITDLNETHSDMVRYFRAPEPVREIALVTSINSIKKALINALREQILQVIPERMKIKEEKEVMNPL